MGRFHTLFLYHRESTLYGKNGFRILMCSPAYGIKAGYAAGNIFVFAANLQVEQEWRFTMKHDDAKVLQEIQRNTEMGMTAIETILDKIEDDEFSLQLSKQSLRYSEFHNRALDRILEDQGEVYHGSQIADLMLKGSIHVNTALNVSREHLAEMMIQGSNRGITSMWKALRHNQLAGHETVELARELVDFEEKNIERLKEYL